MPRKTKNPQSDLEATEVAFERLRDRPTPSEKRKKRRMAKSVEPFLKQPRSYSRQEMLAGFAKMKAKRKTKPAPVRELIAESRRLWEKYYDRPTKLNLRTYIKHHEVMKARQYLHPSKMLGKELAAVAGVLREESKAGRSKAKHSHRIPNPTVPKFERLEKESAALPEILRTAVMADVADAWLQAMGMDNLIRGAQQGIRNGDPAHMMIGRIISAGDLPPSSRYDAYLPWLGKLLRKRAKKALKLVRGTDVERRKRLSEKSIHQAAHWIYLGDEAEEAVDPAFSQLPMWERLEPIWRFRAIVDWAEAEGIDLNRMSLEDILEGADEFGAERAATKTISQGEVVYEFDDGWTVQRLTTEEQLADEGDAMQNCIGDESVGCYTMGGLEMGGRHGSGVKIYSLRDPQGRPHVSMAFNGTIMEEFKGKQNSPPRKPEYIKKAIEFRYELQPGEISGIFDERDWREFEPHIGTYLMSWHNPEGGVVHAFRSPYNELEADYEEALDSQLHWIFGQLAEEHGLEDGPDLENEILANYRSELNEALDDRFWGPHVLEGEHGDRIYGIGLPALWPLVVDGKATLNEVPDADVDEMLQQVVKILKPGRK